MEEYTFVFVPLISAGLIPASIKASNVLSNMCRVIGSVLTVNACEMPKKVLSNFLKSFIFPLYSGSSSKNAKKNLKEN